MNSSFAVLALSMLIALLTGAQAQTVPECNAAIEDLGRKAIRVFKNAEGTSNIDEELCVDFTAFR